MPPAFYLCFMMEIAVQQADKIGFPHRIFFPERRRHNQKVYEIPSLVGVNGSFATDVSEATSPRWSRLCIGFASARTVLRRGVHPAYCQSSARTRRSVMVKMDCVGTALVTRRQHATFCIKAFQAPCRRRDAVHALNIVSHDTPSNSEVDGKAIFVVRESVSPERT